MSASSVTKLSSVVAMAELLLRSGARSFGEARSSPTVRGLRVALGRLVPVARPWPLVLAGAWLLRPAPGAPANVRAEPDLSQALATALSGRGLSVQASQVYWLDRSGSVLGTRLDRPRAVLLARRGTEPADVYLARVKLSPEGRLLELSGLYNVSETSAVEERQLTVDRQRAAWTIGGSGRTYSVHFADLRGEPAPQGEPWARLVRLQHEITNLQDTGQRQGIGMRTFRLDPAATEVALAFSDRSLLIRADEHAIEVWTDGSGRIAGERFVQAQTSQPARPGNFVTWAVDRVRAIPWFGNDRMQAVKAIAFWALDKLENAYGTVTGDDGSERVAEELGEILETPAASFTDPETGWPPAPMKPFLHPPLKGEGQWVSLEHDPFIRSNPGAPNPFVVSFIRTDRERIYSQIYVAMWDPRQVTLHAMSGTKEPKSATGEPGPGLIPRDPKVLTRLVGAFNGGFQASHGEYGMVTDRVVYLPPKPFAATVAELRDGTTVFGTWPREAPIPGNVVSLRQNMTPLVMDGETNPYKREWWGGVPEGWTDDSRTVRSGLCLTKEKFVAYFYGPTIDASRLATAMHRARCEYGLHLDMNAGHTGLEFYRVAPSGQLPRPSRKLDAQWEASGPVPGLERYEYLGRRMIKYMALMNFPRYISREQRDFFYLTLRPLLPSTAVAAPAVPAEPGEGQWTVQGLPQHGWPYAMATTWIRPDATRPETKVNLIELDPTNVQVGGSSGSDQKTIVAFRAPQSGADDGVALWWTESGFKISPKPPEITAQRIATGSLPGVHARASAAMAVSRDGMLIYAEVSTAPLPERDGPLLAKLLQTRDVEAVLLLDRPIGIAIAGQRNLSGHPVTRSRNAVHFVRKSAPGAARFFTDTPIVPPEDWYRAQLKSAKFEGRPRP